MIKKHPILTVKRVDSVASSRTFDISKLESLGYKQQISLEECLKDSMANYDS